MPDDFLSLDALAIAKLVRDGEIGPTEAVEAALGRISSENPRINAVVASDADDALARCREVDPSAPLAGVPTLVKDLGVACAGYATTNGSRFADDRPAPQDSALVARMRAAGLVVCGMTNSPEFGLSTSTEPVRHGKTLNPLDHGLSPGGSSGGSAAAIAAGMVPVAHASDGGGSIRIPAACCGLFGLKPTRARVTPGPFAEESWAGASVGHALTRSVRDSAAILDAIAGPCPGDPYWAAPPARPFLEEVGADPGRLRIALCTESFNGVEVDPGARAAAEQAAKMLEGLGHAVEPAKPAVDPDLIRDGAVTIISAETLAAMRTIAAMSGMGDEWKGLVERTTLRLAEMGEGVSGADYVATLKRLRHAGRLVGTFHDGGYDLLLSPVMAVESIPLGLLDTMSEDVESYKAAVDRTVAFTALHNWTGNPAASVPIRRDGKIPGAFQLAAPHGEEAMLFRVCSQFEKAHPWLDV